jgi:hypothetical protein
VLAVESLAVEELVESSLRENRAVRGVRHSYLYNRRRLELT